MMSIRMNGRPPRLKPWHAYTMLGYIAGAGILAAPDAAMSTNLCVCHSDLILLKERIQGLSLGPTCDDEARTRAAAALQSLVQASDERHLCKPDDEGNLLPQPGSYYVWRNFTAAVLIRTAGPKQGAPDDRCPAPPSNSQVDANVLSASLLACVYRRADGAVIPDYSGIITPFLYYQRPGEGGLPVGFSVGNTTSGRISAAEANLKEYLKNLEDEKGCEEKKACGDSRLQQPFKPPPGGQPQDSAPQGKNEPGDPNKTNTQPGQRNADRTDAKGSDKPSASDGSASATSHGKGGTGGNLPSSGPEWLGRVIRMIAQYYGVDAFLENGLLAMMIIAPQVFDSLAEMSAKLTEGLNSRDLDNAFKNLDDAMAVARALSSLQGVSGQSMSEALATANNAIKELPPEMRRDLEKRLGPKLEQIGKIVEVLKTVDVKTVAEAIGDRSKLDALKDELAKRIKDHAVELAKAEATKVIAKALHTDLNLGTVNAIFSGDVRRAAELTSRDLLGRYGSELGLSSLSDVRQLLKPEGIEKLVRNKVQDRVSNMVNDFERKLGIDQRAIALLKAGASANPKEALIATSISQLPPQFRGLADAARRGDASKQADALREIAVTELRAKAPEAVDALAAGKGLEAASEQVLLSELKKIVPQAKTATSLTDFVGAVSRFDVHLDASQIDQLSAQFGEQSFALVQFIRSSGSFVQMTDITDIALKRFVERLPGAKELYDQQQRQLVGAIRLTLSSFASDVDLPALMSTSSLNDVAELLRGKTRTEFESLIGQLKTATAVPALTNALTALYDNENLAPLHTFAADAVNKARQADSNATPAERGLRNLQAAVSQFPAVLGELSARVLSARTIDDAKRILDAGSGPLLQDLFNAATSAPLTTNVGSVDDLIQRFGNLNPWPDAHREFVNVLAAANLGDAVRKDARLREAVGDPAAFITAASGAAFSKLTDHLYTNANHILDLERQQLSRTLEVELRKALPPSVLTEDIGALANGNVQKLSGKLDDVAKRLHLRREQLDALRKGNTVDAFAELLMKAGHRPAVALDEVMNATEPQAALAKLWQPLISVLPSAQASSLASLLKDRPAGGDFTKIQTEIGILQNELALLGLEHLGPRLDDADLVRTGNSTDLAIRVLNRLFCADAVLQGQYCLWRTAARDQIDAMKAKLAEHVGTNYASAVLDGNAETVVRNLSADIATSVAGPAPLESPKSGAEAVDGRLKALKASDRQIEISVGSLISPRENCIGRQFLRRSELLHLCHRAGRLTAADGSTGAVDSPRCESEAMPTETSLNTECGAP